MRETELWARMEKALGPSYCRTWAEQVVIAEVGGRTVVEALAAGVDAKRVWRAVCTILDLPANVR